MSDLPANTGNQQQSPRTGPPPPDPGADIPRSTQQRAFNGKPPNIRPYVRLSVIGSIVVGLAAAMGSGLSLQYQALFGLDPDISSESLLRLRQALLEYVTSDELDESVDATWGESWSAYPDDDGSLRLILRTSNPFRGLSRVRQVADDFCRSHWAAVLLQRESPSVLEQYLSSRIDEWNSARVEVRNALERDKSNSPVRDRSADRNQLLERWRTLNHDFTEALAKTGEYKAKVVELTEADISETDLVSDEQRRQAYLANDALQQDLKELSVNLMEIKVYLLAVWQATSGPLDRLRASAEEFVETISRNNTEILDGAIMTNDRLAQAAREHASLVSRFVTEWNLGFTSVRSGDVDPYSSNLLDSFEKQDQALDNFLLTAGEHIEDIRTGVDNLQSDPTVTARHHVALSNIVRSHQRLETRHRRFKFSTSGLEVPTNFRLDSALRIARGLRRRTRARIHITEQKLQVDALQQARDQLALDLVEVKKLAELARAQADRIVEELIDIQNELNETHREQESFLRASATLQGMTARIKTIEEALEKAQNRRQHAKTDRQASKTKAEVTVVSILTNGWSLSYNRALTGGGVAGSVTFLTLLLCQQARRRRGPK